MPRSKKYLYDCATAEDNARRQAAFLPQDVVAQNTPLAQQSGAATRRSVVPSPVHPPGRTTHTSPTNHAASMQYTSVSSGSQPEPLDASTRPRMGSIGPSRTARWHPPPPIYKVAHGQNTRPNIEHEAGSSRMAEARQERERKQISNNHRHASIYQQDVHIPHDSPMGFKHQPEFLEQPGGLCPVDCGERLQVIYKTSERAHTVRPAVINNAPGPIAITYIDVTPRAFSALYGGAEQVLDLHKVRTALARQLIEAAMTRVPNADGTYDFSHAAGINRMYVTIAGTGGQWRSESTFLKLVPITKKDLANAWEAARVAAIAEIIEAHEGNGA